jgi:hypothetical protein
VTVSAELAEIHQWWARRSGLTSHAAAFRIADSAYDQITSAGVDNPYWEIIRYARGRHPPPRAFRNGNRILGRDATTPSAGRLTAWRA